MNTAINEAAAVGRPLISVIVPAHNPDRERLRRTLLALRAQTLPPAQWETLVVDNASDAFPDSGWIESVSPQACRIVAEPALGLNRARRRGFTAGRGQIFVLVDDDNLLAPDYLEHVARLFALHPNVGALGGRNVPEFERPPAPWVSEFFPLLALTNHGEQPRHSHGLRPPGSALNQYPAEAAPVGAGMAIRRDAIASWLSAPVDQDLGDRRGHELTSGGDNDIVLTAMQNGWEVGYFPELRLTHLIPAARLSPAYLGRLNHGIRKSWVRVLAKHNACPWPPIPAWTVPARKLRAWFAYRAWSGAPARIRWHGARGHFEGLADIGRKAIPYSHVN